MRLNLVVTEERWSAISFTGKSIWTIVIEEHHVFNGS